MPKSNQMTIRQAYRFCPRCGNKLIRVSSLPTCQNCGFRIFPDNQTSMTGFIITDNLNRVLLIFRQLEPAKNTWAIPGGFSKTGETLERTGRREVKEELNVRSRSKLLYVGSFPTMYSYQDVKRPVVTAYFHLKLSAKEAARVTANEEVKKFRWFRENRIPWERLGFQIDVSALSIFFGY
jgi:ADP-ribose pyrophosphatase YjhB (NUDIX family)